MALPTLASLHRSLPRDLVPHPAGRELPRTPITAVHVSELPDPTQYLEGGELLLTTGLSAVLSVAWFRGYFARLQEAGVVGVALGLGPRFAEPPAPFLAAAASVELPVFVVPAPTPFLTISRRYWELSAVAGRRQVTDALAGHRALVDAAADANPEVAVVRRLAAAVGGWAAHLAPDGRLLHVHPASARGKVRQLHDEVARLSVAGLHGAATLPIDGHVVLLHPLALRSAVAAGGPVAGYVAVGATAPPSSEQRHLVLAGVALLGAQLNHRRQLRAAALAARTPVLQLLLGGHPDTARSVADVVAPELLDGALVPAVITGSAEATAEVTRSLAADEPCVLAWADHRVGRLLFTDQTDVHQLLRATVEVAAGAGVRVAAVLGAPTEFASLTAAFPVLERRAAEVGPGTVVTPTTSGRSLLAQVEPTMAAAWAHDLLAPVIGYHRADLVPALVAYLRHSSAWEPAARELTLHRHTLRHRVRRAEELLGVDLADVDAAAEVWLALRFLGLAADGGTTRS